MSNTQSTSRLRIYSFALGGLPLGFVAFPLAVTIPQFYAGDVGINAATVGVVLFAARMADIITDPIVGRLADRLRTPFGSHRALVGVGIPVFGLSTWMLLSPPPDAGAGYLALWIVGVYIGWTLLELPYNAWGAGLTRDYTLRMHLMGTKEATYQLAQVVSVVLIIGALLVFDLSGNRDVLALVAVCALGAVAVSFLPAFLTLPVPEHTSVYDSFSWSPFVENGPFVRLAVTWALAFIAVSIFTTLALPWMRNVLGLTETQAYLALFLQLLALLLSIPAWMRIGRQIEKHIIVAIALTTGAFISLIAWVLITLFETAYWPVVAYTVGLGLAAGGFVSITPGMIPDVADLDATLAHEQRTGVMFAAMSVVLKTATGFGVLLATTFANQVNFDLSEGALTGVESGAGITLWIIGAPALIFLCGAIVIRRYSLTRSVLLDIQSS